MPSYRDVLTCDAHRHAPPQRQFEQYEQASQQQQMRHHEQKQQQQQAHMDSIEDQTLAIERRTNSYKEQQVTAMLEDITQLDNGIQAGGKQTVTFE
ncbi:hypothetical protein CYMTET_25995 [Cymbomonas tetramitiformis]|uniref:Uncharacterized protein n=1 Tax=Cymbomonas tetramitiformis TaxID=36881 RepID=A0AAE0FTH4_9CHLO|nr:hypothetical protein CYMTET_25995 [Cymbomonas tetramitiformis]